MRPIRSLAEQFEAEAVGQIRSAQERLDRLQITYHASRYFVVEAIRCLEAGLLLAALQVSSAMLELLVRETLAQARMSETKSATRSDMNTLAYRFVKEAEEDRSLSFPRMIDELVDRSILDSAEADLLKVRYSSTRNQLHHAIVGRFVRERSPSDLRDFIESIGLAHFSDARAFEEIIESQGVEELGAILSAIEVVVAKGAV